MPKIDKIMAHAGLEPFPVADLPKRQLIGNQFFVRLVGNRLVIDRNLYTQNVLEASFDRAKYSGSNRGEWGGYLRGSVYSQESANPGPFERLITRNRLRGDNGVLLSGKMHEVRSRSEIEVRGNIVHLQPWGDDLYIFEGCDHLGVSRGTVSVIRDATVPARPEVITLLHEAPVVVYFDSAEMRFFIAGSSSLMSLRDLSMIMKSSSGAKSISDWYQEAWGACWSHYLRPTSIVRFKDYILIGLPFGVAVHSARGPHHMFYGDCKTLRQLNPTG